jgi:hypothetical protein
MSRFQFAWWGLPLAFVGYDEDNVRRFGFFWTGWEWGFERLDPEITSFGRVWSWRLHLGSLEIRRLTDLTMKLNAASRSGRGR